MPHINHSQCLISTTHDTKYQFTIEAYDCKIADFDYTIVTFDFTIVGFDSKLKRARDPCGDFAVEVSYMRGCEFS